MGLKVKKTKHKPEKEKYQYINENMQKLKKGFYNDI